MSKREKRSFSNSILRIVFVGISVLLQAGWILLLVYKLSSYSTYINIATSVLAVLVVLRLYSRHTSSAMKMPWIMLILAFPVMGLSLYLLIALFSDLGRARKRLRTARKLTRSALPENSRLLDELRSQNAAAANISLYLQKYAHAPLYAATETMYHSDAKDAFVQLKEDLKKAQKYIYMEYFIVEDNEAFWQIRDILEERAAAGVDVRLLYDDVGSIGYASFRFARSLQKKGIQCRVFDPVLPVLNFFMNNRDHRKLTVIDGTIGYTGGYNLAREYFDLSRPYGKWKDTGIRMEGDAVRSLTASFLEMWHISGLVEQAPRVVLEHSAVTGNSEGFVQPYTDSPMESERVAENVYLNLLAAARESIWFVTPYLIISDEMISALGLAAKRGVDVRIITPGIPDKKTVYQVTRSYYASLASQGVRIFEYVPGFCHAKQCLCDGVMASIGTSNLDYRSLYHHFENNVFLYGGTVVEQIRQDFEETFPKCAEVTERYRTGPNKVLQMWQCVLRLIAPLL